MALDEVVMMKILWREARYLDRRRKDREAEEVDGCVGVAGDRSGGLAEWFRNCEYMLEHIMLNM
jgi:hypothetical protein